MKGHVLDSDFGRTKPLTALRKSLRSEINDSNI